MSIKSAHEIKAADFPKAWLETGETWTYSSYDSSADTAVFTVPSDATTKYSIGMKIKFTQPTDGVKYGIITAIASTSITAYLGTDYDFDNEAITDPMVSSARAPYGFPMSPDKWSTQITDTSNRTQATPAQNTWYNIGTTNAQIEIPIGCWYVSYQVAPWVSDTATTVSMAVTLSTANNSASDADFTSKIYLSAGSAALNYITTLHREKVLTLTSATLYYLNGNAVDTATTDSINWYNASTKMILRARSAYL